MVFISCIHTITSSTNDDALRCNKVHNDNYYLGQVCVLTDKIIDRTTDWNVQKQNPAVKPAQIKTVIFLDSKVIYIPPQLFKQFSTIERIYLNATDLEDIEEDSFDKADFVKEIYLNQNKLKDINKGAFSQAKQCHILDLSQNQIEKLDDEAFGGLSAVRKLLLNLNRITKISVEVFQPLINLNYLDLSNNNIETFVDGIFDHNRALQKVDLSFNSIKVLSLNLQNNYLIQILDVSSNVIEMASIQRKSDKNKMLTVYAGNNQWICEKLNKTIEELSLVNITMTVNPDYQPPRDRSSVHSIDCYKNASSFLFGSKEINWPILAFVICAAIIFIVGTFMLIFCIRKRSRLYNYIYVLAK